MNKLFLIISKWLTGHKMQAVLSILTPIYWTTAIEVGDAVNGYTLTQGNFRREVRVEFITGIHWE